MTLTVIGSGSSGNAYLLENEEEALLIECGVKISEIKKALNFSFKKVSGALCSHFHGDHSIAVNDLMKSGINVWTSEATHEAMGTTMHHRACMLPEWKLQKIGNFKVKAFNVDHDGVPCYGFLIYHPECGRVLFATDCKYIPGTFDKLSNIIIEANYDQKIIDRKVAEGMNPKFLRNRVLRSHMSLDTCIGALRANDLSMVNNIVLIHLSDSNSHAVNFKKAVERATGRTVTVAENGLRMNFDKVGF